MNMTDDHENKDQVQMGKDDDHFKVRLNGVRELNVQLARFKKYCDAHEKHLRRRRKRRYYQMGIMATVQADTTNDELHRLLMNGVRTFHIDMIGNKRSIVEDAVQRTKNMINEYEKELENFPLLITGLALQIIGDNCRMGRLHNNCSVLLPRGDIIVLTTDRDYVHSGFKEIVFVYNINVYLKHLKIGDTLRIGREVYGHIVKKLSYNVSILIDVPGLINSYEFVDLPNQCYALKQECYKELFESDLAFIKNMGAHYVVLPRVRCKAFLKTLAHSVKNDLKCNLIGAIDLSYVSSRMLDLMGIIKLLDYVWIPDMFYVDSSIRNYIYQDVIPLAKSMQKPIIGTVPLQQCSDFNRFKSHDFLWKIDAMHIEKSRWCGKYPLIVKNLLPIRDFRFAVVNDCTTLLHVLDSYQSIVNFVIRTISSIECQSILIHTKCKTAATALGCMEVYCPVYVLLPLAEETQEEENTCIINLGRSLNLRRNIQCIVYTKEANYCTYKPLEFGIDYVRRQGLLETGDFIITIDVCKESEEEIEYGIGNDVAILSAYYLPPLKSCEKFKFS